MLPFSVYAQKQVEYLNRGVVAVSTGTNQVFISWRMFGTEPDNIAFNVYRGNTKLNASPITNSTNYTDNSGSTGATYHVRAVLNGVEQAPSESASVWGQNFLQVPLQIPPGGSVPDGSFTYSASDCSVGDMDGDGVYEIVVKWDPSNAKDNAHSGYTGNQILDAYKLDGTRLWRIDLGRNIRSGAHYTQFMVYDLDGDGKAEVACKTADGTRDGVGTVIGDANADYRNSSGYILSGPEFLTIFNGETGAAMATTNYLPARGSVSSWGDNYGNRVDRFLAGIGYFDGQRPSLLMCRGYYTRTVLVAWDWRDGQLTRRWTFDTNNSGLGNYAGKGNHQLSIGDVDNDGKDEVVYGAMIVDDNGTGKYYSTWGHGDALHFADIDPDIEGLEVFMPVEWASADPSQGRPGVAMRKAGDGQVLYAHYKDGDIGRGLCADVTASHRGLECWASSGLGMYNAKGQNIGSIPGSINFAIWWDGDLLRELLNGNTIDKHGGNRLLTASGCSSNNGTKSNPALSADIMGDWREEVIFKTTDSRFLNIYTTTITTSNRLRTLMHDPQYRVAIAWQNVAYNQPPHVSFYLGDGMTAPPAPNVVIAGNPVNTDCNGVVDGTAIIDNCGICSGGNTGKTACTGSIQMENACSFDGITETTNSGYLGESYLNVDNAAGTSVMFTLYADAAQTLTLSFRYANGSTTNRDAQILLNGTAVSGNLSFPGTGAWTTWITSDKQLNLNAGVNTIELVAIATEGLPNLDQVSFTATGVSAGSCTEDCNGVFGGTAQTDNCGVCSGGNTGIEPNTTCTQDCNGEWAGTATIDPCGDCSGGNTGVTACTSVIHGEDACHFDGILETTNTGYRGTEYVNTTNATGAFIWWNITSASAETSTVSFRYANGGTTDRTASLLVNGQEQIASVSFPPTGSWTTWAVINVPVNFSVGDNNVQLVALTADGCANLDQVNISSSAQSEGVCIVTGVDKGKSAGVSCYPNPFSSSLNIVADGSFDYLVYDMKGIMVEKGKAENSAEVGQDLDAGLYMITIKTGTATETFKINKHR